MSPGSSSAEGPRSSSSPLPCVQSVFFSIGEKSTRLKTRETADSAWSQTAQKRTPLGNSAEGRPLE